MFISLRHLGWIFSILLHLVVLFGSAYVSTGKHAKIDLNRRMYEVNLVGPPNKGKAGAKGVPKPAAQQAEAPKKPESKDVPTKVETAEPKIPDKKLPAADTAKAIPKDVVNATTVAKAKPEEPTKEEPKKKAPEKEKPKVEEKPKPEAKKETPPKEDPKGAGKKETKKEPTKEEILAQALKDASQSASKGQAKKGQGSGNAVADALASLSGTGSGRGTAGDGTAEDGPGEGISSGSLADYYGTQVKDAIRPNWRFPRVSAATLITTVELKVNQSGDILSARILNSSGRHDYDASVMRAVEETKKLPQLPATLSATLVINFNSMDLQ